MAIDDNTSYELTGAQVKDLAAKIKSKAADNTFTGATSAVAGVKGIVPEPQAGDNTKYLKGDGTWDTIVPSLVEMSYGESSAWSKFINAYNAGAIVYCRASSNANPATGTQGRKAFMAYVNNATTPTEVEFQYVRSVSSKTDSQQGDQVFIYKLTNASGGTWTVTTRNMSPKIDVSGPITKTFTTGANPTVEIGASAMTGATSGAAGTAGVVPAPSAGDQDKVLTGDGTWTALAQTVSDSNGSCIKFADGTMIATVKYTFTAEIKGAWGNCFESPCLTPPDFATSFYSVPVCTASLFEASAQCYIGMGSGKNGITGSYAPTVDRPQKFVLSKPVSETSRSYTVCFTAIGRWKA